MHKLARLTDYQRKKIYEYYKKEMKKSKWKWKEKIYEYLAKEYKVHGNTIRKAIKRWKNWDFSLHDSTRRDRKNKWWKNYLKKEKKIIRKKLREESIQRYEKENPWELAHIDVHKLKNIKWQNPKKKKYLAWIIDDATRLNYTEILPNKKAKTLAEFLKRAYAWFKKHWIIIKKLMTDNWKEFTTHHEVSRVEHNFEKMLVKLKIKHIYTKLRRTQTNWKIERFWQIFEKEFFKKFVFNSWKEVNISMKDWLVYYNTKRKHWGIKYLTPLQKLQILLQ